MKLKTTYLKRVSLLLLLGGMLMSEARAQTATVSDVTVKNITYSERDNTPSSISFGSGYNSSDAQKIFNTYFPINAGSDEMRYSKSDKATSAIKIDRYDQYYKGIKIEHGNYIIASKDNEISYISGNFYKTDASIITVAALTQEQAIAKAKTYTNAKKYMWEFEGGQNMLAIDPRYKGKPLTAPEVVTVYVEDYYSGTEPDGKLHLAYRIDVYAAEPESRNYVYVDAVTGAILFADAQLVHVAATGSSLYSGMVGFNTTLNTNGVYRLYDGTRGGGINTVSLNGGTTLSNYTDVTDTDTSWSTNVAVDAHWGAKEVYDYWMAKHNRNSYDGNGGVLNSYVNYDVGYNNASWNGTAMVYGNGTGRSSGGFDPLVSLDVCAHEIGHGVCSQTARLIYNRESGALNEGFSDIWGATIENYADPHEVDTKAKNNWEIGEEISNTPLRSMQFPKLYGDPDCYKGTNWKYAPSNCSPNTTNDNCGVHSNSGVLNRWYYLFTMGGKGVNDVGNGYEVMGVGFDTAAIIAYGTELSLTSTSNFAATRLASINFATTQFGACSHVVEMLTRAWYAVNVGEDYQDACTPIVSFTTPEQTTTEDALTNACIPSRIVNVPVKLIGPAPSGGSAIVTVNVTGGTAVNGVDYMITNNVLTFPAGSTSAQNLQVTVYDNGHVGDSARFIDFEAVLTPNGSDVALATVLTTSKLVFKNDDNTPRLGTTNTSSSVGANTTTANNQSPFQSRYNQGRAQYIYTATDLANAGLKKGSVIKKIQYSVTQKNSTRAFANFNLNIAHTNLTEFAGDYINVGFTNVFSDSVTTISGTNIITLATPFVWDGENSLVTEICFTNTARGSGNDVIQAQFTGFSRAIIAGNNGTGGGCLVPYSANGLTDVRPYTRFVHDIPSTPIETTASSSRKWNVSKDKRVYFYSTTDSQLIAAIVTDTANDLGCVEVTVSQAGTGFVNSSAISAQRSLKEITITADSTSNRTYQLWFYMTDTERAGLATGTLQMLRTTAITDAAIRNNNMEVVASPVISNGLNYKGFQGKFTGVGRFFLVDRTPELSVTTLSGGSKMWVEKNPFQSQIIIGYNLQKSTDITAHLYDITGRLIKSENTRLNAGNGSYILNTDNNVLLPGHYTLEIVTSEGRFVSKMLKQ